MKVFLVCKLVARSHLPIAILFRIPGYWQLNQLPFGCLMKKASCLIARTDDVVNTLLHYIRFLTVESNLMPQLIGFITTANHGVVVTGRLVVNRIPDSKVFRHVVRG